MTANLQQRTSAWHAARQGKLTASNVGAAMGLCPWTTRQQAYNRAMGSDKFNGKLLSDIIGPYQQRTNLYKYLFGAGNDATQWGVHNEPNGILAYTAHTTNIVETTGLHVHAHTPWLAGSPDGLIGTEGLLEVKCPYWRKRDGTRIHSSIPAHYYLQINLCLECTGRKWCDFISWAPEGYKIYRVTRDNDLHEALMPHYIKFAASMLRQAESPPPLTKDEQDQIVALVNASMEGHIDYTYWDSTDVTQPLPEGCLNLCNGACMNISGNMAKECQAATKDVEALK